ncbi:hypothetical protein HYG93_07480 [Acinetobacter sp. SwsAc6]|uniref:hypothetical protein n=1 Tax=Acinetobacter sp. SwsAc6 TaxID=2749439 RepID=UPI0015B8B7E9|nr:hypothetical protein [Acinetobacter sp. SwsAc6]NWK74130.1 hypothetical protein [Acinetobacter sp. SwsAc6]
MTHIEMLQNPNFKRKLENKIVAHINHEFSKAGRELPLPKFRNDMVTYDDANVMKLVNRIRTGAALLAQLLDEKEDAKNA